MDLIQTQGRATNPRLIQVWLGSGQTQGHCFAYDAVTSEQHVATLQLAQGGWYWRVMTFSWELIGKEGIYQCGAKPSRLS